MSLIKPDKQKAIILILKLPGELCNINCTYCYEHHKMHAERVFITQDRLRSFLEKVSPRPLAIEFHGGEPLILSKSDFDGIFTELKSYSGSIRLSLQTNGILLDQDWIEYFSEQWPGLEYSISLDGDPINNQFRVDKTGKTILPQTEQAIRRLWENNRRIGVMCTVNRASLGREDKTLDYFLQFPNISLIKLNPCFEFKEEQSEYGILPEEFAQFLINIFDYWRESNMYNRILIEPFLSIIKAIAGKKTNFCVYNFSKCTNVVTMYPSGKLYLCDEMEPSLSELGTTDAIVTLDDIYLQPQFGKIINKLNQMMAVCSECTLFEICRGGCLAARHRFSKYNLDEEYCKMQKKIIGHIKGYL